MKYFLCRSLCFRQFSPGLLYSYWRLGNNMKVNWILSKRTTARDAAITDSILVIYTDQLTDISSSISFFLQHVFFLSTVALFIFVLSYVQLFADLLESRLHGLSRDKVFIPKVACYTLMSSNILVFESASCFLSVLLLLMKDLLPHTCCLYTVGFAHMVLCIKYIPVFLCLP